MPPRKGPRNVVKSGNAGNSSKASPLPSKVAATIESSHKKDPNAKDNAPPAVVRPPPSQLKSTNPTKYSASVTLRKRKNKNAQDFDTVRFVAGERVCDGDAAMARHLGAVYALFRVGAVDHGERPGRVFPKTKSTWGICQTVPDAQCSPSSRNERYTRGATASETRGVSLDAVSD
ncbi:hypothetical protein QFC20_006249 [Naganishia adeliensis]|uniref:Uncharacterized protein n=1 Tax=Naganishia adeliensis TaxID=92952 RepID=A0ACC2VER9_9TREE|nr:hypothetical protein QFC20_006249 [Naganishia adeliensis]